MTNALLPTKPFCCFSEDKVRITAINHLVLLFAEIMLRRALSPS